jgi:hypothetical protein
MGANLRKTLAAWKIADGATLVCAQCGLRVCRLASGDLTAGRPNRTSTTIPPT